jgi:hypothetical protein
MIFKSNSGVLGIEWQETSFRVVAWDCSFFCG